MTRSHKASPAAPAGRPRRSAPPAEAGAGRTPSANPAAGQGAAGAAGAVDRALAILDALAAQDGLALSDLARGLGLAPSTTHRLLGALAARRLAEVDAATQGWSVGPAAVRLGAAFLRRGGLAERARPLLDRLAADSGETAVLVVPDGDAALVVAEAAGAPSLRVVMPPGTRLPYHASAAGKALIAHLPLSRVRVLLGADGALPALTHRTLTDGGELIADLATLRHSGWLAERDEAAEGQSAVAAPVFGGLDDPVAALALAGPSLRLESRMAALGPVVCAAARQLGAALGGRPAAQ
ncbi:IclR family transcriptional regulator [Paracoccus contaminans]|nr:IclR family transcriptional regulator [Paracoccus contaminans]